MKHIDIITLDFETYWSSKDYTLSKVGPISYIRDARFEAQLLGIRVNEGPAEVFEAGDIAYVLRALELHKPNRVCVGHNLCGFDGLILAEQYGIHPWKVMDTMVAMRWVGLSRIMGESHAALTAKLQNGEKEAGTVISDGKHWPHDFTEDERARFKKYCRDDVIQCYDNFADMRPYLPVDLYDSCTMTLRMATQSKFYLDKNLLMQYAAEQDAAVSKARADLQRIFAFSSDAEFLKAVRSAPTFTTMLRQLGVEPPMKFSEAKTATAVAKATALAEAVSGTPEAAAILENIASGAYDQYSPALSKNDLEFTALLEHPDERVVQLVQTRLEHNSSILRSRTDRFLALAESGKPMPIMLNLMKAHTSRFAAGSSEGSDGLNVQNINKRNPKQLTLRKAIRVPTGYKLVAADSRQIEARMLPYQAGEEVLLSHFREGRDPYAEQASSIYGIPAKEIYEGAKAGDKKLKAYRNVGKTAVLSAGYGVGAKKFSDTLLRSGIRLNNDLDKHYEMAKEAHAIYRATNPNIVAFWKLCQGIVEDLASGGSGVFGGPTGASYRYGWHAPLPGLDKEPTIWLPSGFPLVYHNLRCVAGDRKYEYVYDRPKGRSMVPTRLYGGSLTENLIQGTSAQMLQWQALGIMRDGITVAFNIHDAWGAVAEDARVDAVVDRMTYWMSSVPEWLPDFPVDCEVEVGDDFCVA